MGLVYLGKNMILQGVFGQIEPDVMEYANTYLLIVTASCYLSHFTMVERRFFGQWETLKLQ